MTIFKATDKQPDPPVTGEACPGILTGRMQKIKKEPIFSDFKRFKALFEYLSELYFKFRVKCTYRTGIIFRKIIKSSSCPDTAVGLAALRVVDISTD